MSKHEHKHEEICVHFFLKYCKVCNVVYCEACHKEWGEHKHVEPYVYPYRWPQPWKYEPTRWEYTTVGDTSDNVGHYECAQGEGK